MPQDACMQIFFFKYPLYFGIGGKKVRYYMDTKIFFFFLPPVFIAYLLKNNNTNDRVYAVLNCFDKPV